MVLSYDIQNCSSSLPGAPTPWFMPAVRAPARKPKLVPAAAGAALARHVVAATVLLNLIVAVWARLGVLLEPLHRIGRGWTRLVAVRKVPALDAVRLDTSGADHDAVADILFGNDGDSAAGAVQLRHSGHSDALVDFVVFQLQLERLPGAHPSPRNVRAKQRAALGHGACDGRDRFFIRDGRVGVEAHAAEKVHLVAVARDGEGYGVLVGADDAGESGGRGRGG
jgi:hypothetical protein